MIVFSGRKQIICLIQRSNFINDGGLAFRHFLLNRPNPFLPLIESHARALIPLVHYFPETRQNVFKVFFFLFEFFFLNLEKGVEAVWIFGGEIMLFIPLKRMC